MIKALPASLASLCLVLVLTLAYEAIAPTSTPAPVPNKAQKFSFQIPPRLIAPPETDFDVIDQRPIFNPARTPVPDASQSASSAGSLADLTLVGVIIAPERSVALFEDKSTGQSVSASTGDMVLTWRVRSIDASHAVLSGGSGTYILPLSSGSSPSSPPVNPPPMAPEMPQKAPATDEQAHVAAAANAPKPFVISQTPSRATPTGKVDLPVLTAHGSIAPEALKSAPIDPSTGEPTL